MTPSTLQLRRAPGAAQAALLLGGLALGAPMLGAQISRAATARAALPRTIEIARRAGTLRVVDSTAATTPAADAPIQLERGKFLATRVAEVVKVDIRRPPPGTTGGSGQPAGDTVLLLPFRYSGVSAANREVFLRPKVIRGSPLRYAADRGVFAGSLLIALEDSLSPATREQLSGPIRISLVSEGDVISPDTLDFTYTNRPLMRVTVEARDPTDSVAVRVIPEFDLRGVVVSLPVRPALAFERTPATVEGLGVEAATIPIAVRGVSVHDSVTISVSTDQGSLDVRRVRVGPDGTASVRLRSAGLGVAHVRASSPGLAPVEVSVAFRWPVWFLLSALLGGALGALTSALVRRRRPSLGRVAVVGMLVGLVVAVVYYALGVKLISFDVRADHFDAAAVFAFAILGGAFGIPLLAPAKPPRPAT